MPAKRPHVEHMRAFCRHTRMRFEPTHGGFFRVPSRATHHTEHIADTTHNPTHTPTDTTHHTSHTNTTHNDTHTTIHHNTKNAHPTHTLSTNTTNTLNAHAQHTTDIHIQIQIHIHIHIHIHTHLSLVKKGMEGLTRIKKGRRGVFLVTMRPKINSNDFCGFLELISRFEFEFDFRRCGIFFEGFEFLVCSKFNHTPCGRTCACAVACLLHPHNSISNVVASVTIYDDIFFLHIFEK